MSQTVILAMTEQEEQVVDSMDSLTYLRNSLREFAEKRDWDQFHSPKNLASALVVEAGELLEPFQWLTTEQSCNLDAEQVAAVREEMADVFFTGVALQRRGIRRRFRSRISSR